MNERIKELAEQAHLTSLCTKGMQDIVDGCYIVSPAKLEKFAELIVKETMQVVANTLPQNTYLDVADAVIEHFKE